LDDFGDEAELLTKRLQGRLDPFDELRVGLVVLRFFGSRRPFSVSMEGLPGALQGSTPASRADARRRPVEPRLHYLTLAYLGGPAKRCLLPPSARRPPPVRSRDQLAHRLVLVELYASDQGPAPSLGAVDLVLHLDHRPRQPDARSTRSGRPRPHRASAGLGSAGSSSPAVVSSAPGTSREPSIEPDGLHGRGRVAPMRRTAR
jgi:hypothetical protein